MNDGLRFVFDTKVFVSSLILPNSTAHSALAHALEFGKLLVSQDTLDELTEVLGRKKMERYLGEESRQDFLDVVAHNAIRVDIQETIAACRDPKDDMFLELAVAGNAACLVSGDADLLVLDPFRGIPILTPRAFLERIW